MFVTGLRIGALLGVVFLLPSCVGGLVGSSFERAGGCQTTSMELVFAAPLQHQSRTFCGDVAVSLQGEVVKLFPITYDLSGDRNNVVVLPDEKARRSLLEVSSGRSYRAYVEGVLRPQPECFAPARNPQWGCSPYRYPIDIKVRLLRRR